MYLKGCKVSFSLSLSLSFSLSRSPSLFLSLSCSHSLSLYHPLSLSLYLFSHIRLLSRWCSTAVLTLTTSMLSSRLCMRPILTRVLRFSPSSCQRRFLHPPTPFLPFYFRVWTVEIELLCTLVGSSELNTNSRSGRWGFLHNISTLRWPLAKMVRVWMCLP